MKTARQSTFEYSVVAILLGFVLIVWAAEEQEAKQTSFETCLEELKQATSSSTDEESENDFEPELSLEESIRIYDECLSREGVTLSIHSALGESGGSGASDGSAGSQTTNNGTEDSSEAKMTGANASTQSPAPTQSSDLESSLHEFDEMLSQMQGEIDAERAQQQAEATSESTQPSLESATVSQDGTVETSGEESEGSHLNPSAMASAEAKHQDTSKREPLDPKDEDIILKTIREAAELETDPTTKQALWDQYYDYADKK
ncbi:MAG: hypothetical protein F4W92_00460 [Gammaproteobacteria bacterium]|nr:hypothetical protein [Gammaproteobacteria bacterium]